jgi:hypothetical protein
MLLAATKRDHQSDGTCASLASFDVGVAALGRYAFAKSRS